LPLSYYIYYRVAQPAEALALVQELQAELKSGLGVAGRWLRKRDDPSVWMEIYEDVEDAVAFEERLAAAVQRVDFAVVLNTGASRHMECFEN
jgi:hypothetical protein